MLAPDPKGVGPPVGDHQHRCSGREVLRPLEQVDARLEHRSAPALDPYPAGDLGGGQIARVVRGRVEFHIRPLDTPRDQFLDNPWVIIRDHAGQQMDEVRAPRNRQTGICSVAVDTTRYRDGQYQVEIKYRTLVGGQPLTTKREMTLAVRNGSLRPGRFSVDHVLNGFWNSPPAPSRA